jgi:hypothetical protein
MILAGPRLWRRSSQPQAARGESGLVPYLLDPALPRRQPISINPQTESATVASAVMLCTAVAGRRLVVDGCSNRLLSGAAKGQ